MHITPEIIEAFCKRSDLTENSLTYHKLKLGSNKHLAKVDANHAVKLKNNIFMHVSLFKVNELKYLHEIKPKNKNNRTSRFKIYHPITGKG